MLQSIRDRAQGWVAWVIIGLIIVPFALWGIQEYVGNDSDVTIARVGDYFDGTDISQREFQQAYEQQRQRIRSLLGDNADQLDEAKIKQNVSDGLITNEVLRQSTGKLGLRVSNAELGQQIQSMPEFHDNGQFSKTVFLEQLRRSELTPEGFETRVRDALLTEQLNAGITSMALVTQGELDEAIRLKNQQREIGYLVLPWKKFENEVTVDAAEIKKYYDEHRDKLVNPEQIKIEYIELSANDLAKNIKLDEQELHKLYEEQRANFAVEEQRRASQILIAPEKDADPAALAAASTKADDMRKRLHAGEDFAKLAKQNSPNIAAANVGGDLGFVAKGSLDPAVEQALNALKPGEVSQPVKSPAGFHILKLTEIKPAHTKPFEEVRADLEKDYRQRKARELYFEKSEPLTNFVYENPDTLTVAAQELGLPIKTTDYFSRKGGADSVTSQAKIINAAFSNEVLSQRYNSEPIEIGENHLVVVRVKQHKEASARTLEQERQAITEKLRTIAAQKKARGAGETIQKRLDQGADPQTIAKEYQVDWVKPALVGRADTDVKIPGLVKAAFVLRKPGKSTQAESPRVVGGTGLESGDYAVIVVYAVKEGSPAAMDASARLALRRELQRTKAESEYQNLVDALKDETKIVIHEDKL
ncbi:MAG: SurA N-terminal domain-containing protein [Gammaproteobacteria bacterium]